MGTYSAPCQPVNLPVNNIRQKNLCGCGLAALEMVLKYYGATDTQTEFLADKRIRRQVQNAGRGLSEGTIGILALRLGFSAFIYGENPQVAKTYLRLGGTLKNIRTGKNLILKCLRGRVPPIVLIPRVSEAYEHEKEEIGHYVVVTGVDHRCYLRVSDPQYVEAPKQEYWNRWSSSLIEIKPILNVHRCEILPGCR
jgi:ABC-type bacteriocin/lantibiotic exporter with double-glycine peptidase domain